MFLTAPLSAQQNNANQNQALLTLVIVDQTGAGIPMAEVIVTPKGGAPVTYKANERGMAIAPPMTPGDVVVHVEFPGFLPFEAPLTLRRGAQNQIVTLNIEGFKSEVAVSQDNAPEASKSTSSFSLSQAEIDALPDDPEELAEILSQMAGPGGATFFMNGFQGGSLPNRDQIRSIRFRQNNYAADNHDAGRSQVEIVTRPNTTWAGNVNTTVGRRQVQRPATRSSRRDSLIRSATSSSASAVRSRRDERASVSTSATTTPTAPEPDYRDRRVRQLAIDAAARTTQGQKGFQFGLEHSLTAEPGAALQRAAQPEREPEQRRRTVHAPGARLEQLK